MNIPPFPGFILKRPFVYLRKTTAGQFDLFIAVPLEAKTQCTQSGYSYNAEDNKMELKFDISAGTSPSPWIWYKSYVNITGGVLYDGSIEVTVDNVVSRILRTADPDINDEPYDKEIAYNAPYLYFRPHPLTWGHIPYGLIPLLETAVNMQNTTQTVEKNDAPNTVMQFLSGPVPGGVPSEYNTLYVIDTRTIEVIDADTSAEIQWSLLDGLDTYYLTRSGAYDVVNTFEIRLKDGSNSGSAAMSLVARGGGRKTKTVNKVKAGAINGFFQSLRDLIVSVLDRLIKFK